MKRLMVILFIFNSYVFCEEGIFTIKSFMPSLLTISSSSVPQIALEIKPISRLSFEIGYGFAIEEDHNGEYSG